MFFKYFKSLFLHCREIRKERERERRGQEKVALWYFRIQVINAALLTYRRCVRFYKI